MKKILITAVFLGISMMVFGQQMFWASKVEQVSGGSKPDQVLGKPNALPAGGYSFVAWNPGSSKDLQASITVSYDIPMQIQQVAVGENLCPGTISAIMLYDERGTEYKVYSNPYPSPIFDVQSRMFTHIFPMTPYKVAKVKLMLDYRKFSSYPQIDCIGISKDKVPSTAKINTLDYSVAPGLPENLGPAVNSAYNDMLPIISPDGKTLYFARKKAPENYGAEKKDDIYFSSLTMSQTWAPAKNIGSPLNTDDHNFVCAISPDGNTMYLANKYSYRNDPSGLSIAYKKRDGTWSKPESLNITNMYNKSDFVCYHVSLDSKVIVMAVERDDTKGDMDLYVSFRYADGTYSSPVNMGDDINTVGAEASVFLAADGKTIYFASNGHPGYGDFDMYMSRRLDNSWKRWSEPVNLGDKINTPGIDIYYTIPAKGDYAYFSSSGYGYGQNDLFRILLPKEVRPEPVSITEGLYASDIPANLPTIPTTAVEPAVVTAVPQPVPAKPITEPKAMVPVNAESTTDLDARIAELKRQLQGQQSPASSKSASITVATPTSKAAEPKPDYSAPKAANVFENYTPTEQVDPAFDNQINELKRQLELTKLNTPAPKYSTPTTPATSVSQATPATPSTPPAKSKEILALEEKLKKAEAALEKTKTRPQEVQEPIRIAKSEKPPVEAPLAVQIEKPLVKDVLADAKETPTNQEKSNNVTYTPIVIPSETTQNVVKETPVLVSNELKIETENLSNADSLNALRASLENEINQLTLAKEKEAQQALAHQKATEKLNTENQTLSSEKEKIAAEIAALEAEKAKIQSEKLKLEKEKSQLEALRQQQFIEINQRKRQIDSLQNAQIAAEKTAPTTYVAFEDELNIPLQVGTTVQLKNVYFVANAAFLQDKSFAELDKLVAFLKKNKQLKVEIGGHTNGICDDAFCLDLSSRRAKTVLDYLVQKGIAATQLSAKGYGKSQPIADNYTVEGRKMNQRVEIKIVSVN